MLVEPFASELADQLNAVIDAAQARLSLPPVEMSA